MQTQTLKKDVVVNEKTYFVCIFLQDEECLVKKKRCSKNKEDKECQQVEDVLQ